MKFIKGFLCASTATLVLTFFGCKKNSRSNSSERADSEGSSTFSSKFTPRVDDDAVIALGLNLDLQKVAKIGESFFDQVTAMAGEPDKKLITEFKEREYKGPWSLLFNNAAFKSATKDNKDLVEALEKELRNGKIGWAVLSAGRLNFKEGSFKLKTVPEAAIAVATDINVEKIVEHARRCAAEHGKVNFVLSEGTIADEKSWWIIPRKSYDKEKFEEMHLKPCFTSLDNQLVLLASTPSALEKQIRLYRDGQGESSLLRDFKPANDVLAHLTIKPLWKALSPRGVGKIPVSNGYITFGDEMVLGIRELDLCLSSRSSGQTTLSLKLHTDSDKDANRLRGMAMMYESMANNPDAGVLKDVADLVKHMKTTCSGPVLEAEFDDVLSTFAGPKVLTAARRAKATEAVVNAKTALERLFLKENKWPPEILNATKRNGYYVIDGEIASLISYPAPSGGTATDILVYFAVDRNEDGFVERDEGAPVGAVRAKAITWCAAADRADSKDVRSWQFGEEVGGLNRKMK